MKVDKDILLKNLEIQWEDHFQTREQTWKALTISLSLAAALIGLEWTLQNSTLTLISTFLLIFVALSGMQITVRHRNNVEVNKFKQIGEIENKLGIGKDLPQPKPIRYWHIINPLKASTSLFLLRIQFAILVFALSFFVHRLQLILEFI